MISGTAERKRDNGGVPARALDQGARRGRPVLPHNEISLPVPGHLAAGDLAGTIVDGTHAHDPGAESNRPARLALLAADRSSTPKAASSPLARRTSRCKSSRAIPPVQPARRTGRTSTGPPPDPARTRGANRTPPGSAAPDQHPSSGLLGGIAPPPPATAPGARGISPVRHCGRFPGIRPTRHARYGPRSPCSSSISPDSAIFPHDPQASTAVKALPRTPRTIIRSAETPSKKHHRQEDINTSGKITLSRIAPSPSPLVIKVPRHKAARQSRIT